MRSLAARLRRQLLQRPGITARPVCPACGETHDPTDFTRDGICRLCEATRAADYAAYLHADLNPDGTTKMPPPRDEMVDE